MSSINLWLFQIFILHWVLRNSNKQVFCQNYAKTTIFSKILERKQSSEIGRKSVAANGIVVFLSATNKGSGKIPDVKGHWWSVPSMMPKKAEPWRAPDVECRCYTSPALKNKQLPRRRLTHMRISSWYWNKMWIQRVPFNAMQLFLLFWEQTEVSQRVRNFGLHKSIASRCRAWIEVITQPLKLLAMFPFCFAAIFLGPHHIHNAGWSNQRPSKDQTS